MQKVTAAAAEECPTQNIIAFTNVSFVGLWKCIPGLGLTGQILISLLEIRTLNYRIVQVAFSIEGLGAEVSLKINSFVWDLTSKQSCCAPPISHDINVKLFFFNFKTK